MTDVCVRGVEGNEYQSTVCDPAEDCRVIYSCVSDCRLKGVGDDQVVLLLQSDSAFSRLAAVSSDFKLNLLDTPTLQSVLSIYGHNSRVTDLRFLPDNDDMVITSCLDGFLRHFDLRSGKCVLMQSDSISSETKRLTCADVSTDSRLVCAGTELVAEDVFLVFWDMRSPNPLGGYWESHSDEITCVRFDRHSRGMISTGSLDGLVNIHDLNQPNESESLQMTFNCPDTAASLTWFERGNVSHLAAATCTEGVHVWDTNDGNELIKSNRENICSIISVTPPSCFVAGCHGVDDEGLLVLVGTDVGDCCGSLRLLSMCDSAVNLRGHGQLVSNQYAPPLVRVSWMHSDSSTLVTAGETAVLQLWKRTD